MAYMIDGHNLIPKLGLRLDSLDDEEQLLALLQEFCRLRRAQVEVYFDGAWRLLDAHKGHWLEPAGQYVAFRHGRDEAPNPIGRSQRFRVLGELEVRLM